MSLAEFRNSGQDCPDIGAYIGIDFDDETPKAGRIYADCCYIERYGDGWRLFIERSEWFDTLSVLEAILYGEWYVMEAVYL